VLVGSRDDSCGSLCTLSRAMISGYCGTGPSAAWEAKIDAVPIWQNVVAHFEQFERQLLDEILVFANLIQIPAVILTGGVAWLVCRPIRRWVTGWVERVPEHHHLDWIVSHRSWVPTGWCR